MPLLEGLDGVQKMSKSLGNYVGIDEAPTDMFGKLMSISDELMWRYYELLSFRSSADIAALRRQVGEGRNPRDVKFELAHEIVARFHDPRAAEAAQAEFVARFQKGQVPSDIRKVTIAAGAAKLKIANLLKEAGLAQSTTSAYRLIDQGAVRLGGEKLSDRDRVVEAGTYIVQVGKREFAEVTVTYTTA
jgi:tyrosyl-tRNA synthetase